MKVKVQVSKLTQTSSGQISGGTYWFDEAMAKELVSGGNAKIIETGGDAKTVIAPQEPPFLPSKTSKSDAPKVVKKVVKKPEDKN